MKEIAQLTLIIAVAVLAIGGMMALGHHIVVNGLMMGIITICGIAILWIKAPPFLKGFLAKGDVIVDAAFTIGAFAAFGFSITGLIGAGITCIFMSILLKANRIYYLKK